jgi:hypothetical protein
VGYEKTVTHDPRFPRAITDRALGPVTRSAGSKLTNVISEDATTPRFVECDPVLNFGAKSLENHPCVIFKVCNEFFLVQEASVTLVEFIREIPMEQGNEGDNPSGMQVVNEFHIMLYTFLINRIVSAAEWDNTGPGVEA